LQYYVKQASVALIPVFGCDNSSVKNVAKSPPTVGYFAGDQLLCPKSELSITIGMVHGLLNHKCTKEINYVK